MYPADQYPFGVSMCLQCYHSDDSRQSSANLRISDSIPTMMSFIYNENNGDREQCHAAHQTKQMPIEILHHLGPINIDWWVRGTIDYSHDRTTLVAYCTEMNQSIRGDRCRLMHFFFFFFFLLWTYLSNLLADLDDLCICVNNLLYCI